MLTLSYLRNFRDSSNLPKFSKIYECNANKDLLKIGPDLHECDWWFDWNHGFFFCYQFKQSMRKIFFSIILNLKTVSLFPFPSSKIKKKLERKIVNQQHFASNTQHIPKQIPSAFWIQIAFNGLQTIHACRFSETLDNKRG